MRGLWKRRRQVDAAQPDPLAKLTDYELRNLVRHLADAGRHDDVHRLLALETAAGRNALDAAREAHDDTAGYLADVELARRLATQASAEAIAGGRGAERLDAEFAHSLTIASVRSFAAGLPPGLLAALVDRGALATQPAVVYARQVADGAARATALARLAPRLAPDQAQAVLREALSATRLAANENLGFRALRTVAASIPRDQSALAIPFVEALESPAARSELLATLGYVDDALREARSVQVDGRRALALARLVPHRPALAAESLEAAASFSRLRPDGSFSIGDNEWRGHEARLALIPTLDEPLLQRAEALVREVPNRTQRIEELAALAARREGMQRNALVEEAVAAASDGNRSQRVDALTPLVAFLPAADIRRILRSGRLWARVLREADERALRLAEVAERLPAAHHTRYLAAARTLPRGQPRLRALAAVIPHLDAARRPPVVAEALALAQAGPARDAIEALAPYLDAAQLRTAMTATRTIGDADARGRALAALGPWLPRELRGVAVAACALIEDPGSRASALAALAPHLSPPLTEDALALARKLAARNWRARAVVALTAHAPGDEALAALRRNDNESSREEGLALLAPQLRGKHMREALDLALGWGHGPVAALAPHLTERDLEYAVEYAAGHADAPTLAMLVPHLPDRLVGDVLEATAQLDEPSWPLIALAPRLDEAGARRAVALLAAFRFESDRVNVLAHLAPRLPEPVEPTVERIVAATAADRRAALLAAFAHALAAAGRPATQPVLDAVLSIETGHRANALHALAPVLPPPLLESALAQVRASRWDVAALAHAFPEPRRTELATEVLDGVVAGPVNTTNFDLELVLGLLDAGGMDRVATWLAEAGGAMEYLTEQVAAVLPDAAAVRLARAAVGLASDPVRPRVLSALAPRLAHLEPSTLHDFCRQWLDTGAQRTRADLIAEAGALAPALAAVAPPSAVAGVADAIERAARWWS